MAVLSPAILTALALLTVDPLAPQVVALVAAGPGFEAQAAQITLALLSVTPRDRLRLLSAPSRELENARRGRISAPLAEPLTEASLEDALRWLRDQIPLRTHGLPPLVFLIRLGELPAPLQEDALDPSVLRVEEGGEDFARWLLLARHGLPAPRAALRLAHLEGPVLVQVSPDGPVLLTLPPVNQEIAIALPPGNYQVLEAVGVSEGLLAQLAIGEGQQATVTAQSFNAAVVLGASARALLTPPAPPEEPPSLVELQLGVALGAPLSLVGLVSAQHDLQPLRVGLQAEWRATLSSPHGHALLGAASVGLHRTLQRIDLGVFAIGGARLSISPERSLRPALGGGAEGLLALSRSSGMGLRLQLVDTIGGGVQAEVLAGLFLRF